MSGTRDRWVVWLVGLGDFARLPNGTVRTFDSPDAARAAAQELGGIVQLEGSPILGGFDRALS